MLVQLTKPYPAQYTEEQCEGKPDCPPSFELDDYDIFGSGDEESCPWLPSDDDSDETLQSHSNTTQEQEGSVEHLYSFKSWICERCNFINS